MSDVMGIYAHRPAVRGTSAVRTWTRPDNRRVLQLALAAIWLLDGILQLQGFFFTKAFGSQMLTMTAGGNPRVIADPITWTATTTAHHAVLADSFFAAIQILIGLGIAWRSTLKPALVASIVWALGVWWLGEGLGGVLNGAADPINGAPGAVIVYALLAVLLWPRRDTDGSFAAASGLGAAWARALWVVLWGSLAYFALAGSNDAPQAVHDLVSSEASGEPGWLAWLDRNAASLLAHQGLATAVVLSVLLGIVALGVFLPRALANATLVLAAVLAAAIWVVGENFGALLTNSATDVNSGPLLALLALSFWQPARRPAAEGAVPETVETTGAPA